MKGPDKIYGPLLASLFQKLAMDIKKECGATNVRIKCEFLLKGTKGDMKIQTFTTPDAKTERLLDPDTPLPRGTQLQHDVDGKLRDSLLRLLKHLGG